MKNEKKIVIAHRSQSKPLTEGVIKSNIKIPVNTEKPNITPKPQPKPK